MLFGFEFSDDEVKQADESTKRPAPQLFVFVLSHAGGKGVEFVAAPMPNETPVIATISSMAEVPLMSCSTASVVVAAIATTPITKCPIDVNLVTARPSRRLGSIESYSESG